MRKRFWSLWKLEGAISTHCTSSKLKFDRLIFPIYCHECVDRASLNMLICLLLNLVEKRVCYMNFKFWFQKHFSSIRAYKWELDQMNRIFEFYVARRFYPCMIRWILEKNVESPPESNRRRRSEGGAPPSTSMARVCLVSACVYAHVYFWLDFMRLTKPVCAVDRLLACHAINETLRFIRSWTWCVRVRSFAMYFFKFQLNFSHLPGTHRFDP